jgi:general secretion pathway protein D
MMRKILSLTIIILVFLGCTVLNRNYKLGTEAAVNKDWDAAIEYYERAMREDPDNSVYRLALLRVKVAASLTHLQQARSLASQNKKEKAQAEYERALFYDPTNVAIAAEAKRLMEEEVKEEKPREVKIELPVKLKVDKKKLQLKFVNASLRSIFQALAKSASINIIFDEQFRDVPFTIDLADMTLEQALNSLCLASKNFYTIIDEKTIIVAPDQPVKRVQYELDAIKTFYLSNIQAQDIQGPLRQMLQTQFRAPNIIIDKNLNSVTVRGAPSLVELADKIIHVWDKPKGEVIIDLEIMEVSSTRLRQLGLDFEQHIIGFRYSGTQESETGWLNLKDIDLSKRENYQITLPSALIQFLEQDVDTKIISQPRLRGVEGEKIEYLVGDKIPIPRTTFTPIAAGGVSQQPVTSFTYEDVGIDMKITPRIHFENEITLELEIKLRSLGGSGYADIPIITTREVKNIIRLKDGETNLLAGLLKDEERKTLKGIAGLKNIPVLGSLFSSTDQTIQQTDVILTITPHIIRTIPLSAEDLKPLWADLGGVSPTGRTIGQEVGEEPAELELMRESMQEERERETAPQNQVFLNPSSFEVPQGREFRISVNLRSGEEIGNMSISISFNSQVLSLKDVIKGGFIDQLGEAPPFLKNIDNESGACTIGFSSPEIGKGIKGTGRLATLVFESKGMGESMISVADVSANSPGGENLSFQTRDARVMVR